MKCAIPYTVEPRLSGPPLSGNLDYPAWQFLKNNYSNIKMGVSAAVTMNTGMTAHAQTPTFTAVYQLSGWIKA